MNDITLAWPVAGTFRTLASDVEFTAAFSGLDIPRSWKPMTRTSFCMLAGWKQKQAIEALRTPPPYVYHFPHGEVTPVKHLETVNWSTCIGVQRSDAGSEGVLFVELQGKQAVVVKAPLYVVSEMFGNVLCGRLGVMCPNVRLVASSSPEGKLLVEFLVKADAWRNPEERKVQAMLSARPLFLVIEYVQARDLASWFGPESHAWSKAVFGLGPSDSPGLLSHHGKEVLRSLGALVAFDLIINNFDRLPCVWDNKGNASNLMFANASAEPLSIDNMVFCIAPEHARATAKYMERVKEVVADCIHHVCMGVEQFEFARIRMFLKDGCPEGQGWSGLGIDIGVEGTLEIQTGFMNLVHFSVYGDNCQDGENITLEWLEEVRSALLQQLPGDNPLRDAPKHMYGFDSVHPQFCAAVIDAFQSALEQVWEETGGYLGVGREARKPRKSAPSLTGSTTQGRLDKSSGTLLNGGERLPMFMTPDTRKTFLEHHDRRKAQLKMDAAQKLQMKPRETRLAQAQKLRRTPDGFYSLEVLARLPPWPAGVEANRREMWLSPADFQRVFGMSKDEFGKLPLWTQQHRKKKVNLF